MVDRIAFVEKMENARVDGRPPQLYTRNQLLLDRQSAPRDHLQTNRTVGASERASSLELESGERAGGR